jgi:hypothetical protein
MPIQDRYVVKMEIYASHDPAELTEADVDEDHLEAISDLLDQNEELDDSETIAPAYKNLRYDLCRECHKKFLNDPLGKEAAQNFDFSEN